MTTEKRPFGQTSISDGNGRTRPSRASVPATLLLAIGLLSASISPAMAQTEDDLFLFTSSVSPNVLIQLPMSRSVFWMTCAKRLRLSRHPLNLQ